MWSKLSAYLRKYNIMRTIPILNIKTENQTTKTITFNDKLCSRAKPGQFIMLWIPRVDEIPLSIMNSQKGEVSVTVKAVGSATNSLNSMKKGQNIGVRGPFGNWFSTRSNKCLLIGGGVGIVPLYFLLKKIVGDDKQITFINGAKTENELLFMSSIKILCKNQTILSTTEDGSYGYKGIITESLTKILRQEEFDIIYACGPESMMRNVFDIAELYKIPLEASLERLMRCGIGLCGSCVIGQYRVCRDGPIFNSKQLRKIQDEFGFSRLDFNGKKIPI